jgi:hypothetical protein
VTKTVDGENLAVTKEFISRATICHADLFGIFLKKDCGQAAMTEMKTNVAFLMTLLIQTKLIMLHLSSFLRKQESRRRPRESGEPDKETGFPFSWETLDSRLRGNDNTQNLCQLT